ncbi:YecA family protein [Clostridium disporicum]|uniref:YecA family protein n=1 Tax=Clostridium disporicum TaxID=84024 RepID=UPI0034A2B1B9
MSKEIGRNDKCPCMSGKKYKNCCKDNSLIQELKEQGISYYDEKYFFQNLNENESFKKYYECNRSKVNEFIITGVVENLGASMSYGTYPYKPDKELWFILNNKESQVEKFKSLDAAHEIQHIINHYNGYPSVGFKEQYLGNPNMPCRNISDMLNDPMVNREILKYGFDMRSYFDRADIIQIPIIETFSGHEKNTFIITICVKRYLDYKNINPTIDINDIAFINHCKSKYNSLEKYWLQIISWINQVGYENRDSAAIIFEKTIELLGYKEYIELKYF